MKIFAADYKGMVGSALLRQLEKQNDVELILADHKLLDLTNQQQVYDFFYQAQGWSGLFSSC